MTLMITMMVVGGGGGGNDNDDNVTEIILTLDARHTSFINLTFLFVCACLSAYLLLIAGGEECLKKTHLRIIEL